MADDIQGGGPEALLIDLNNRIRVLENKNSLLGEKLLVINQNMIEEYKNLLKEMKSLDEEIKELKKDMFNVKNILKHLSEEASSFAKKDNLKVLEKYINLWNPLKFVTREEVERIIKEYIKYKNMEGVGEKEDAGQQPTN